MNKNIEKAILLLTSLIHNNVTPDEALKLTQAASNLAHAGSILSITNKGY